MIFKRERFSLVSCHPVEYFRRGVPLLDRDNVGLIVLLRPMDPYVSLSNVCVANTHLLYNPRRGDIKLAQLAMLLAEINRVSQLPDSSVCPVLLCGDFNSVPWSPLYRFIKDRRLDYDGMPIGKVKNLFFFFFLTHFWHLVNFQTCRFCRCQDRRRPQKGSVF